MGCAARCHRSMLTQLRQNPGGAAIAGFAVAYLGFVPVT